MFGSLKKKLKEALLRTKPKKEEIEEALKEEPRKDDAREEIEELEEKAAETHDDVERVVGKEVEEDKEEEKAEDIVEEIKEKQEDQKELVEKIERRVEPVTVEDVEKALEEEVKEKKQEEVMKPEAITEEEPKEKIKPDTEKKLSVSFAPKKEKLQTGFLHSVVKRVKEKTLEEDDVKDILKSMELALLENDVALEVTEKIISDLRENLVGKNVKRGEAEKVVHESLRQSLLEVMQQEDVDIEDILKERKEPLTVLFLGFNGVGKTTTLAKIAHKFKEYKPVIAAGDTFRAASIEQLEEHGQRIGAKVIKHDYGSDSAAVIFDAKKHATASDSKLVLADTAGRSHSNTNLMDELKKVVRVNKPDLKILVLDAVTGNDIYDQARLFNEAVGVDGIILTKTDVYEKGGAAISAAHTIKKPILYMGTGQEYEELAKFNPEKIVENILG